MTKDEAMLLAAVKLVGESREGSYAVYRDLVKDVAAVLKVGEPSAAIWSDLPGLDNVDVTVNWKVKKVVVESEGEVTL